LSRCADRRRGAGSGAASASRGRLLAFGASSQHVFVRMSRVSHSNRHGNCKQRDGKSLQHRFFLPGHSVKKATKRGGLVCNTYVPHSLSDARIFKANCGVADLDLNQHLLTPGGFAIGFHASPASRKAKLQPETNGASKRLHPPDREVPCRSIAFSKTRHSTRNTLT
jgi:hypothetical protein